jgi:hypothetical protein
MQIYSHLLSDRIYFTFNQFSLTRRKGNSVIYVKDLEKTEGAINNGQRSHVKVVHQLKIHKQNRVFTFYTRKCINFTHLSHKPIK